MPRLCIVDRGEDRLRRLTELGLGRMKDGRLRFPGQVGSRPSEVADRDAVERPAVRARRILEIRARLGERDVQTGLSRLDATAYELECDGRLAGARIPLDEIGRASCRERV